MQSAMRNAVQKKIKDLEETQLQKLESSRVEYRMYDFDSAPRTSPLPFPPVPSSFEFTTHSRAQRSPGVPHEVLRRNMYIFILLQLGLRGQYIAKNKV